MKFCYDSNIKVVPQGGNTSLSGGAIPISDEIIVSLEKMNKIVEIDQVNGVLVAEAGCVLQNLSTEVGKHNLMIPLDLGAKGSCMIGGNVATNAGGVRVMRYGSLHHNVLGLEVVLPDGRVVDMLKKLRKDNSGFPLKHVFIGSEGCLGIITKVAIQVLTKPKATSVVILKVDSFDKATRLLVRVREEMSEVVSAFEYLDAPSIQAVRAITPTLIQK
jgi:FAD/FMN-containing dehydrogenase